MAIRCFETIAQRMAQVSQGISVCSLISPTGVANQSIIQPSLSLRQYLESCLHEEAIDGPLTDYESSGDDEANAFDGPLSDCSLSDDGNICTDTTGFPIAPAVRELTATEKKVLSWRAHVEKKRERRRVKRKEKQEEEKTDMKQKTKRRRCEARNDAFKLDFDLATDLLPTKPSWIGRRNLDYDDLPKHALSKDQLVEQYGIKCIPWDGQTPHLLLDREGLVVGALAGRPRDKGWGRVHRSAFKVLSSAASKFKYSRKELSNRRGPFPTVAHGISFGGGQQSPRYLRHGKRKEKLLDCLLNHKAIQRLCSFASCAFNAYSERNYERMKETVKTVKEKLNLGRDYESRLGVFPCRSFNLGAQTASLPHRDMGNLAHSWCTVTAVGQFDPKQGGHLVLWDFGIAIEFPPGSTIMIPSALFIHSNASIQAGETRYSIVQYAAGGLFRWVSNGCKTDKEWEESLKGGDDFKEIKRRRQAEQVARQQTSAKMFSRWEEIAC